MSHFRWQKINDCHEIHHKDFRDSSAFSCSSMHILGSTERFGFALIHMVNSRTFLVPFVLYLVSPSRAEGNIGSTPHLKDIVFGRCWDFQLQKVNEVKPKNCSTIWGKFHQGFAYKDPCNLTSADYKPYFDEIGMDVVNPNKVNVTWTKIEILRWHLV